MSTIRVNIRDWGPQASRIDLNLEVKNAFHPERYTTKWTIYYNTSVPYARVKSSIANREEMTSKDSELLSLLDLMLETDKRTVFAIALDSKLKQLFKNERVKGRII